MNLVHIPIFVVVTLAASLVRRAPWRHWIMLVVSVLVLFWLQPASPIRNLDFWLPLATLTLTVLVWLFTRPPDIRSLASGDWITLAVVALLVMGVGLLRYVDPVCCITASRPPQVWQIIMALCVLGGLVFLVARLLPGRKWVVVSALVLLIGLLVILKAPPLTEAASAALRSVMGQSRQQASAFDIRWLGISYVFFRLVSTLRDWQAKKLPDLTLLEYFNYLIFFPTITSGPVDRPDRFAKSYHQAFNQSWQNVYEGCRRICIGLFKKYALADTLALFALNDINAVQTSSTGWLWVMLYGYAFRLWLDFSGYSDIAIGLAQLLGIKVPENFDRPYLKLNLTDFWNSWHMSLALWFRAYYFNYISRGMRTRWKNVHVALMIAISQITTMALIGLWHGVTLNYLIWGLWHGIGLFIHNRWVSLTRTRLAWIKERPALKLITDVLSVLLTFHYVALSWVWFALADTRVSWNVLLRLLGLG
jgi:alginate O-acetyltransferase complex protein AlgI